MIALTFLISSIGFFFGTMAGTGYMDVYHSVMGAVLTFFLVYALIHLVPEIS